MANVTALDFVGGGCGGHAFTRCGALLLDDADDAVADAGVALLAYDHGAFDNGGARVVDAVEHGLSVGRNGLVGVLGWWDGCIQCEGKGWEGRWESRTDF